MHSGSKVPFPTTFSSYFFLFCIKATLLKKRSLNLGIFLAMRNEICLLFSFKAPLTKATLVLNPNKTSSHSHQPRLKQETSNGRKIRGRDLDQGDVYPTTVLLYRIPRIAVKPKPVFERLRFWLVCRSISEGEENNLSCT